jgi:Cys-Gly metallodipeptidase DUG1
LKDDGWTTEPFVLTHDAKTDRLYGRGSTDDKGPVLGWLNVIQAHQQAGIDFPVNLLMCFEGMEENGSEGLDELIADEAKAFFKDADCVCISDNYWLGTTKPCLTVNPLDLVNSVRSPWSELFQGYRQRASQGFTFRRLWRNSP